MLHWQQLTNNLLITYSNPLIRMPIKKLKLNSSYDCKSAFHEQN